MADSSPSKMSYYAVISCLLALTVTTKADAFGGLVYAPGHSSVDYYAYPRYAFDYSVKDPHTGDNKAQWEKRDGDVVKGAYSLVEPDGSLRVVEYWADDKSGFNAVVKRYGPNLHPTPVSHAPIYKAPIPVLGHGAVGPYSIGSVAKFGGLATAPLLTGPLHGGAISSASMFKSSAPIVKTILPSAAILPSPILSDPITKSNPFIAPLQAPLFKPAPLWPAPLPLLKAPYDLSSLSGWGDSLMKGPQLHDYDIGHNLLAKGPVLPGWSIPLPYPSYNGYKDY